jgi:hypothetical protein
VIASNELGFVWVLYHWVLPKTAVATRPAVSLLSLNCSRANIHRGRNTGVAHEFLKPPPLQVEDFSDTRPQADLHRLMV